MSSVQEDHYSRSGMFIFGLSMLISLLFFVYIAFIHPGVTGVNKIKDMDSEDVESVKPQAKAKPLSKEEKEKPWKFSDNFVAHGKAVYAQNCASCHGEKGLGDGIAATPETRNLVEGDWKQGGTSIALFKTLQNGIEGTGMVSFKDQIKPVDRWSLVHYIRSITENKPEDDEEKLKAFAKKAD